MARVTGLEPATSGVTGRRSNQLSYTRLGFGAAQIWEHRQGVNSAFARLVVLWCRDRFIVVVIVAAH